VVAVSLLIAKLALVGMRPGEIFALTWGEISDSVNIKQRVYRGVIDTPKSSHSERKAALPDRLKKELAQWKKAAGEVTDKEYVFPSEKMTPLQIENVWRRHFKPKLEEAELGWVNFQVLRRSSATLLNVLGVGAKVVASQLGHTVDVNQNVYTQSPVSERRRALNRLERKLG
jgi:integrase